MNYNQVLQYIVQWIYENHANKITGDILQDVLIEMLQYVKANDDNFDIDIQNLQNQIDNITISQNLNVFEGIDNPNVTPPTDPYDAPDIYVKTDTDDLFIFSGAEWVQLTNQPEINSVLTEFRIDNLGADTDTAVVNFINNLTPPYNKNGNENIVITLYENDEQVKTFWLVGAGKGLYGAGQNQISVDNLVSFVGNGSGGGGIPDAPSDGKTYGRKNEAWTEITDGIETNNTPDIELSGDGTGGNPIEAELTNTVKNDIQKGVTAQGWGNHADAGYEKESNKATDLSNPDNTKYPTTKAVTDALNDIDATVHTNNTGDIELSGDGTQGNPLEGILTQNVKDDIEKGMDAYNWGDWKEGDLDDMKNESADPFVRVSEIGDPNPTLDDVAKNGNVTEEDIQIKMLTTTNNFGATSFYKINYGQQFYLNMDGETNFVLMKTDIPEDSAGGYSAFIRGGGYQDEATIITQISFRWASAGLSHDHQNKILTSSERMYDFKIMAIDGFVHLFFKYTPGPIFSIRYGNIYIDSANFKITDFQYINYDTHPDWNLVSDLNVDYLVLRSWLRSKFVRFDQAQSLTPAEQENARANLGLNIIPSVIALMHGEAEEDIYPVLPNLQWDITIQSIVLVSRDTVTGSDLEARILVDDTPQQGADLIIPANSRASNEVNLIDWDAGQNIDLEVTQTGSTDAGSNLALYIFYSLRN